MAPRNRNTERGYRVQLRMEGGGKGPALDVRATSPAQAREIAKAHREHTTGYIWTPTAVRRANNAVGPNNPGPETLTLRDLRSAAPSYSAPLTRAQEARLDELCEDHGTLRIDSFRSTAGQFARVTGADGWSAVLDS